MWEDIYKTSLANFQSACPSPEGIVLFLNLAIMRKVLATGQRSVACLDNSNGHVWGRRWLL